MKHLYDSELTRRIDTNRAELNATHNAMIDQLDGTARCSVFSDEWASLSERFNALAAQSDELHAEADRRAANRATAALADLRRKLAGA